MIESANDAESFIENVKEISATDPFACRIISLCNSYNPGLVFVDYWLVRDENGENNGAIARNGSNFILFITEKSDIEEVSSFMRVAGASAVICDGRFTLDLFGSKTNEGSVLLRNTSFDEEEKGFLFIEPDIKSAYELILKSADDNFTPPKFEDFYVDVNHKLRHRTSRLVGIDEGGELIAVAMTVAESDSAAVLGAVASDPERRNQGLGSGLIKHLINELISENKSVYLHRAKNANIDFYKNLGFTEYGTWREYYFDR